MRHFAAASCWGLIVALFVLFAAFLWIPAVDGSSMASWSLLLLVSAVSTRFVIQRLRDAPDLDASDPIDSAVRGRILRWLAVIWTTAYAGASVLSQGRGVPAIRLPMDAWIAFSPAWTPIYMTAFVIVVVPLLMLNRERDLRALAWAYAITLGISAVVFVVYPMEVTRPAVPSNGLVSSWGLATLYAIDSRRNVFPSLHAGLGVCGAIQSFRVGRLTGVIYAVVLASFCVSTIAIRQHVVLDLLAGFVVAGLASAVAARIVKRRKHL